MRIVCLQHVPFEGPAEIAAWAELRGHSLEIVPLYEGDPIHPKTADFLVIMGGPMNIYEEVEHPYLSTEKAYIRSMVDGGALVLGVCLGAQLLADVMGAKVTRGEHAEIGWYPVSRVPGADACPVMGLLPSVMDVLHWHGDTFGIPDDTVRAYASEACENQAFSHDDGRVIGLQFHLEQNRESLEALVAACGEDLVDGEWIHSADHMLASDERFADSNEALFKLLDAMSATRVRE